MENNIETNDALDASIIFAKALSFILEDKQGIVVDIPEDSKVFESTKKVVVFKFMDKIHIYKSEDVIPEGTAVLIDTNLFENKD